jgi:hypothetical protein
MSNSSEGTASRCGLRTGVDLLIATVGDKDFYTWDDHVAAGLPMIIACTGRTSTMAGAAALIDDDGQCWCPECAPIRGGV